MYWHVVLNSIWNPVFFFGIIFLSTATCVHSYSLEVFRSPWRICVWGSNDLKDVIPVAKSTPVLLLQAQVYLCIFPVDTSIIMAVCMKGVFLSGREGVWFQQHPTKTSVEKEVWLEVMFLKHATSNLWKTACGSCIAGICPLGTPQAPVQPQRQCLEEAKEGSN